jgi:hypothetical protein
MFEGNMSLFTSCTNTDALKVQRAPNRTEGWCVKFNFKIDEWKLETIILQNKRNARVPCPVRWTMKYLA